MAIDATEPDIHSNMSVGERKANDEPYLALGSTPLFQCFPLLNTTKAFMKGSVR